MGRGGSAYYRGEQVDERDSEKRDHDTAQQEAVHAAHGGAFGWIAAMPDPYHVAQFAPDQEGVHRPEHGGGADAVQVALVSEFRRGQVSLPLVDLLVRIPCLNGLLDP